MCGRTSRYDARARDDGDDLIAPVFNSTPFPVGALGGSTRQSRLDDAGRAAAKTLRWCFPVVCSRVPVPG